MFKKFFYFLTTLLLVTSTVTDARGYRYYNTRENYPVLKKPQREFTQQQIDSAWIQVPWTHGGYYYHNKLTREDVDSMPQCLQNNN